MSLCTSHIYWLQLFLMYWNEPCVALDILKNVVHSLSHVWLFVTPRTSACQASRSFTIFCSLHKLIFIESVIPPKNLVLCHSLILLPSTFSSIKVFLMSQLFSSGSGLLRNIQDWFLLGLTGLSSLLFEGLARVFHSTTIQKHQFGTGPILLYGLTLTSLHDYWRKHSFDYTNLCPQSDVSAF